jgi:hypothetical protein
MQDDILIKTNSHSIEASCHSSEPILARRNLCRKEIAVGVVCRQLAMTRLCMTDPLHSTISICRVVAVVYPQRAWRKQTCDLETLSEIGSMNETPQVECLQDRPHHYEIHQRPSSPWI